MLLGNKPLDPLVKWVGGKRKELSILKNYYPTSFKRFIDIFVGGGSEFFDLNFDNNIINDSNVELINLYRHIADGKSHLLHRELQQCKHTEEEYYKNRKLFNHIKLKDKLDESDNFALAWIFMYINKIAYRGQMRFNKKGEFNIPYGHYKTIPNYKALLDKNYYDLLNNHTTIFNLDYKKFINQIKFTKDDFIFLEPPYDCIMNNYGYGAFDKSNFIFIKDFMQKTSAKVLLVLNKTEFTFNIFKDFYKTEYNYKYSYRTQKGYIKNKDIEAIHMICLNF